MCPCQSSGPQSGAKRGNLRTITSRKIGTRLDPELWLLLPRFSLEGVDSVKSGTHRRPSEGDGAAGEATDHCLFPLWPCLCLWHPSPPFEGTQCYSQPGPLRWPRTGAQNKLVPAAALQIQQGWADL